MRKQSMDNQDYRIQRQLSPMYMEYSIKMSQKGRSFFIIENWTYDVYSYDSKTERLRRNMPRFMRDIPLDFCYKEVRLSKFEFSQN